MPEMLSLQRRGDDRGRPWRGSDSPCAGAYHGGTLPPVQAAAAILGPGESYRRQARRLRCRFAAQPARLQQSLKRLAAETPSPISPRTSHAAAVDTAAAATAAAARPVAYPGLAQTRPARRFADYLRHQTSGPMTVLRYSQRLEFLRAARRFGVGRFEANLLIAAVLDRRAGQVPQRAEPSADSALGALAAFLLVEAAVLFGAWWAVFV
jgi:hypothetical protein